MSAPRENALLFAGSSNPALAQETAACLGIKLGQMSLERFPDGEVSVQIKESVRGKDVFVLQSVALDPNFYLMEVLIIIDALRRASAKSVVAVLPYFGYSRQDRKDKPRVPITAKLVANLLVEAGATRILVVDLHAGQLEGFFDIPVDNIHARGPLLEKLKDFHLKDGIVVAPGIGSVKLARTYANQLNLDLAVVNRQTNADGVDEIALIGDVKGKDVLLADDMCSGGRTLVSAAQACHGKGAKRIVAVITHGLFVGEAAAKIEKSPLEAVLTTNTIPSTSRWASSTKLASISIAPLLAHAIRCILSDESISTLK